MKNNLEAIKSKKCSLEDYVDVIHEYLDDMDELKAKYPHNYTVIKTLLAGLVQHTDEAMVHIHDMQQTIDEQEVIVKARR